MNKREQILLLAQDILNCSSEELFEFQNKAKEFTSKNFGNRRTFFNPIYLSNVCNGDCLYCGYRSSNKIALRKTLTPDETLKEALFLKKRGVNNLLFLAGEYEQDKYVDMLCKNISIVKKKIQPNWIGIEVASLSKLAYRELINVGVQCVTLFQETYDIKRYNELHKKGSKTDFFYRLHTLHRAAESGIREVGLGVLYGISNWYLDTLGMIQHGLSLKEEFPNIKLRFSFPRLVESECQDDKARTENINEKLLDRIIITFRNCFQNSSLVLTGREKSDFLIHALNYINIIGKAGSTVVGGYCLSLNNSSQFKLKEDQDYYEFTNNIPIHFIF